MPIIKSSKKALRQSARNRIQNDKRRKSFRDTVKAYRESPSKKLLPAVFSTLDRAVDNKVIHKNQASRLKSRLSVLVK